MNVNGDPHLKAVPTATVSPIDLAEKYVVRDYNNVATQTGLSRVEGWVSRVELSYRRHSQ